LSINSFQVGLYHKYGEVLSIYEEIIDPDTYMEQENLNDQFDFTATFLSQSRGERY
jgi:hypothetical protein